MTFSGYLKQPFLFLKDNFLTIMHPFNSVAKMQEKRMSVKYLFLSLLFISILRLPIECSHWETVYYNDHGSFFVWDALNLFGLFTQTIIFLMFIYPLAVLILDILLRYGFKQKSHYKLLFNLYLHVLILYSFSELVSLFLALLKMPSHFEIETESFYMIVTGGQIFEGICLGLLTFIFIYRITGRKFPSFICVITIGIIFPLIFAAPSLIYPLIQQVYQIQTLGGTDEAFHIINWMGQNVFFLLFIPLFYLLYLYFYKGGIKKQLKWLKPFPIFNYIYLAIIGFFLGGLSLTITELISLIIAIVAVWNLCGLINDYFDVRIDLITHVERPYVGGLMNKWDIAMLSFWLLAFLMSFSLMISFAATFLILIYLVAGILYSAPPFRLKKYPFATFFIGITCFLTILIGATPTTFRSTQYTTRFPIEFPGFSVIVISIIICIIATLLSTMKDYKDIEGDRADGIKTLPIYVGEKKSILVIKIFTIISYFLLIPVLIIYRYPLWTIIFPIVSMLFTYYLLHKFTTNITPKTAKKLYGFCFSLFFISLIGFFF